MKNLLVFEIIGLINGERSTYTTTLMGYNIVDVLKTLPSTISVNSIKTI
jgi:hypothetical protein